MLGVRERAEIHEEVASLADEYAAKMMAAMDAAPSRKEAEVALAGAFLSFLADAVRLVQSAS